MLRLDILGILISVFLLGPRNWRWTLAAAGIAKLTTILMLMVWRVELTAYTMGGLFTQVDTAGRFTSIIIALSGPFACYAVARLAVVQPMGSSGWLKQLLPWSELEHPMAATFAKFGLLAGVFSLVKVFN